ncbi:hypothetical protein BH09ACT9_BH09ACT9_00720 [soil metagenome]
MADTSIFNATVPTDGTLANAHERILRMFRGGVFENITGDITDLKCTPTLIPQARENYGQKGRSSQNKLGDNWVVTFDVEVIRDATGEVAQPWLLDLLVIADSTQKANKNDFQWFDALSASIPAHEGTFSVVAEPKTVGFAEKASYTITLTSDGVVDTITSPIAGTGVPIIESALPTAKSVGQNVVVRGYNLGALTAATIGGVPVTSITQIPGNPYVVVLEVPAGTAGSAPIICTSAAGASTAAPYMRGA